MISSIPNKLTSGPDSVPNSLLKKCIFTLVLPLYLLFNKPLNSSVFASKWKESIIFSQFSRVTIKIILKIAWYWKGLICQEQHEFSMNNTTISNLTTYQLTVYQNMEDRKQTDSVYTGFSKSKDCPHDRTWKIKLAFI